MHILKIIPVQTKKDLNNFIKLPYNIYKNYKYWVPPLNIDIKGRLSEKHNPFFEFSSQQLFLAIKNKECVGRIAAIENTLHNKIHNERAGFFGYFECIDDQDTANLLFDTAKKWLNERNINIIKGPANPSSNDEYGLLVDGFNDYPRLMMPYNPEYYIKLIENYGFTKAHDLYAYELVSDTVLSTEKLIRGVELVKQRTGVKIRNLKLKSINSELELVKKIYNQAWAPNWGFVPFTENQINQAAKDLKPLIDENLVLFAEINDQAVGFALVMPDYNEIFKDLNGRLFPFGIFKLLLRRKKIQWARILILGLIPEFQKKGLDSLLYFEITKRARERGILRGEGSWILDDNEMINKGMQSIGGKIYKKYRIYELEIK